MGKKADVYAQRERTAAMVDMLTELGYEAGAVGDEIVIARGETVHLWVDFRYDHICFGKARNFDRWSNSRDYKFEGIHDDKDDLAIVLRIAEDCAAKGIRRDDYEPIGLNQWWRHYKREARQAERAAALSDETAAPGL